MGSEDDWVKWKPQHRLNASIGRRTLLRMGRADLIVMIIPALLIALGGLASTGGGGGWDFATAMILFAYLWVFMFYFFTASAAITVTPHEVIVDNQLRQYRVPRHVVLSAIDTDYRSRGELLLSTGPPVKIAALNTALSANRGIYASSWGAQLVSRMLDEIPPEPSSGDVVVRIRYGHVLMVVIACIALIIAVIALSL